MNIEQAKSIPLSEILDKLNIKPFKIKGEDIWYLSPLREERTASFHINTRKNCWYDFGEGIGGDSVSFVCAYLKTQEDEDHTVVDALRWLGNMMGTTPRLTLPVQAIRDKVTQQDSPLILKTRKDIRHRSLIRYVENRGIPLDLAKRYLKELYLKNETTGSHFYALGFPNIEYGYELRNPQFKGCLRPKAVSFISGRTHRPKGIHIFEGFFDFLSALAALNETRFKADTIVLNSVACMYQAEQLIKDHGYKMAYTWLDNDKAGDEATARLTELFRAEKFTKHHRMNSKYRPHKDVNAWHMHNLHLSL